MGRKRTHVDPDRPLRTGLQLHGNKYRARRPGGPWHTFGSKYAEACRLYALWREQRGAAPDTLAWLLDHFVDKECPARVKAKLLSPRTARDYERDAKIMKLGLGHIPYASLEPGHIIDFRNERAQTAPTHVRHELACLSAALTYAVESKRIAHNVCRDVDRPARTVRDRLVTDDEFLTVYERAAAATRLAMTLAVRTLALPSDILRMGPRNVARLPDGRRVLRYARGKTGVKIEVEIVGELAAVIDECLAADVVYPTFVHRRDGKAFTVDGIGSMFRRYCVGSKESPQENPVADFGLRDLRAKGATDEYRAGRPLRELQHLLGHKSIRTTEIYIKQFVAETVRPNERPIIAEAK